MSAPFTRLSCSTWATLESKLSSSRSIAICNRILLCPVGHDRRHVSIDPEIEMRLASSDLMTWSHVCAGVLHVVVQKKPAVRSSRSLV